MTDIYNIIMKYNNNEIFLGFLIFGKVFEEVVATKEFSLLDDNDIETYFDYIRATSGHYSTINYGSSKFSILTFDNNEFFYIIH